MNVDLLYAAVPDDEIRRDRWGRPLIDGVPHARCSTIAKALDDQGNLITWAAERTLLGAALRPDLVDAAFAARDDKRRLRDLADQAKTAAGGSSGANRGTALHALVEQCVRGDLVPCDIPDPGQRRDVEAVMAALAPYQVVGSEVFVADPLRMIAGTTDLVLSDGARSFVADIKSSSGSTDYLLGPTAIQLAAYAGSAPFVPGEGYRRWPSDFTEDFGLLIHMPIGTGTVTLVGLDLREGRAGLDLALRVRAWRSAHRRRVRAS